MTAKRHIPTGTPQVPDTPPAGNWTHRRTFIVGAAAALVLAGGLGIGLSAIASGGASASVLTNCAAVPSKCGFPDATNTGVPKGTTLQTVPGQVSSGAGWHFDSRGWVVVDGNGAVLSGLSIPYSVQVAASNVTIKDDQIVTDATRGVSLQNTAGVTIENSTISGLNATTGRVNYGISDVYGNSTGMVISNDNISLFRSAVQLSSGQVVGNYIHDPGYISGDHTNGVLANGGTQELTINHNTIFNSLTQTDAITINTSTISGPVTSKIIENNLLAGAGYPLYGGAGFGHTSSGIVVTNNRFGQQYYPKSGKYGPVTDFASTGVGNVWSGNVWDSTGAAVPSP